MNNYYLITIKKLNKEKIINKIKDEFVVFDIKLKDDEMSLKVKNMQAKKLITYFKTNNIEIINIKKIGLFNKLFNNYLSIPLLITALVGFIALNILNLFIFNINIIGNEKINSQQIIDAININTFTSKSSINSSSIVKNIEKIRGVSFASCIIKGNTLIINIKEKLSNSEIDDKGNFLPIVSNFNGKITQISLIQGTAIVKIGQNVRIGQELVLPYIIDTSGNKCEVLPKADIKADVWVVAENSVFDSKIEFVDTGNSIKSKEILFMGISIYEKSDKNEFLHYRMEEKVSNISNGNVLPIKIKDIIIYEQEEKLININFEQDKLKYIEQTKQMALLNINECDIIKSEYSDIQSGAGFNTVVYVIVVNKSIN